MRVAALLIVLYFVSSVAFADFWTTEGGGFAGFGAAPKASDASAAGKKAQEESLKLVNGNIERDGKRSELAIKNSKVEIFGGSVSDLSNFSIQSDDLKEVLAGIANQKLKCQEECDRIIKALTKAVEDAKKKPCAKSDDGKEDCTERDKAVEAANQELQAAKDAKTNDCEKPLDDLSAKVKVMKVKVEEAKAQAKKVRDASQGFGGSGGGGGGGGSGDKKKPDEVTVECLKGVAYLNPACDEFFKRYCMSTPDEAVCANWAGHYCGFDFAAGSPRPHADEVACIVGTPYYFCNGEFKEERKNCQSCKDLKTIIETKKAPYYSTDQLVADRNTCPDDPILKTPSAIEQLNIYDNSTPSTGYQNQSLDPNRYRYRK